MKENWNNIDEKTMQALTESLLPVEAVRGQLACNPNGSVQQSLPNCVCVLENDPVLRGAIRWNILTGRMMIARPVPWKREDDSLTENDFNNILMYFQENYGLNNDKRVRQALEIIAYRHSYHPICEYLNALNWDGQERIRYALRHFLGAPADDVTYESLKLFLLGAINRVFHRGCKFESMLCLIGGQGAGKSTFFRLLAIRDEWFSDDLKRLDDDKVYARLSGHWIIEMSEMLATINAKNAEEIKSFLSRQKETYRTPYETYPEDRKRQCVFGGSTNKQAFLPFDRTGNRRFIPVAVDMEQAEVHILDDEAASRAYIIQMWAEAMELYRSGNYSLTLPRNIEKQVNLLRQQFMAEDTVAGRIKSYLEQYEGDHVCSLQLYREALNHPFDDPKRGDLNEINEIMNNVISGWQQGPQHRFAKYGQQRSWVCVNEGCKRTPSKPAFPSGFIEIADCPDLPFST